MKRASSIWIVIVAALASLSAAANSLPLIDAVKAGNVETVRTLLKQRVDVNAALPDDLRCTGPCSELHGTCAPVACSRCQGQRRQSLRCDPAHSPPPVATPPWPKRCSRPAPIRT